MRVYLPATETVLRRLHESSRVSGALPLTAFAVTPGLREWYVEGDDEELEYVAMSEAARASLRLLDADPGAARRRVVVAADVPDHAVAVHDDLDRGVVRIAVAVELPAIAAIHLDDSDAEAAVTVAAAAILAADLGDETAQEAVYDADGFELSWYAPQELPALVGELAGG